MKAAIFEVLIALDQLLNTVLSLLALGWMGTGWADETISCRAWRESGRSKGWARARRAIDALFFYQPDHCFEAFVSEQLRRHMPPELRNPVAVEIPQ